MDGYEATRQIRALEQGGDRIHIVAMTANAMPADREVCLKAGMDDYVSKPINVAAVQRVLMRWLGQSGADLADSGTFAPLPLPAPENAKDCSPRPAAV